MTNTGTSLPALQDWEPMRDTLSAYAKAVAAVPRALAEPHPKWWHVSLRVTPAGLETVEMNPAELDGESLKVSMDLGSHRIVIATSDGREYALDMRKGLTASEIGDWLSKGLDNLGVPHAFQREKFEDASPRGYDERIAGDYLKAIRLIDGAMKDHRAALSGERGPVQLWPHHFDLSFEWYGTLTVPYEEEGQTVEYPSQINFGFSPGDGSHARPYFYSNPWPFDAGLSKNALPSGARWFTEGWEGTLLPYDSLVGDAEGLAKLKAYFKAVYDLASQALLV